VLTQATPVGFRAATAADDAALRALLASAKLPFDDVSAARQEFIVAVADGQIVGCGALETFDGAALLRSLAVAAQHRGAGVGDDLYERLVARAKERGLTRLFLLTTTAAPYFARRGFEAVDRAAAPAPMTKSAQFASLCPSTATCMALSL
jgi:amino-acid N-acetyltransferase